jgi:hypothetical protein
MSALVSTVSPWTPRRAFRLPQDDEAFLDATGFRWETVVEGGAQRLVIYDYPVGAGYNQAAVDLHFRIEGGYPDVQIDMVYVSPALAKTTGGAIGALSSEPFDGRTWQRWSRHRTAAHPWRPGLDNVDTHLALVDEWFAREVGR